MEDIQKIVEDLREHIDFDKWHGKAFRLVTTPPGKSVNAEGEPISDEPGRVSVVTPENGDAWKNWPDAHPDTVRHFRKNWQEIQTTLLPYKRGQIDRAIESLLKEKNEIFSQISSTERNMSIDLEKAVKMSTDLECENFYIKKAIENLMREVDAAKGCHDTQDK